MKISKIDGVVEFDGGDAGRSLIALLTRAKINTIEIKEANQVGDAVRILFEITVTVIDNRTFKIFAHIDTQLWDWIGREGQINFDEYDTVLNELEEIAIFE